MDADPELIEDGVGARSDRGLADHVDRTAEGGGLRMEPEEPVAESARKIIEAGKTLYERLCSMTTGHLENLGKKLDGAMDHTTKPSARCRRVVFPAARKFAELDRSLESEGLPDLEPLEKSARQLDAPDWRDEDVENQLLFPEEADSAKA